MKRQGSHAGESATAAPVRVHIHVQPRASRSEIAGWHGDAIKVRLTAPPIENAANEELVALLSRTLDLPRSAIRIVAGLRGRSKIVEVVGATAEQIEQLATSASA